MGQRVKGLPLRARMYVQLHPCHSMAVLNKDSYKICDNCQWISGCQPDNCQCQSLAGVAGRPSASWQLVHVLTQTLSISVGKLDWPGHGKLLDRRRGTTSNYYCLPSTSAFPPVGLRVHWGAPQAGMHLSGGFFHLLCPCPTRAAVESCRRL